MKLKHELIQSNGTLPFNMFVFHGINSKRIIPQHWHRSSELIYCIDGKLNVRISSKFYQLSPNDMIFINPNTVHSTQSPISNKVFVLQLPLSYLQTLTENQFDHQFLFQLNTAQKKNEKNELLRLLLNQLANIAAINRNTLSLAKKIKSKSLVLDLLSELINNYSVYKSKNTIAEASDSVKLMNDVTDYIDKHFSKKLTLHTIAQKFNYSDSYFSRNFKAWFNMNFYDFLISVRLNEAINLMMTTDQSIITISQNSGFATYRNFYNAFVRVYQIAPSRYRNKIETKH